jgi:hypothetical protein
MNALVFNIALLVGVVLIGVGVGLDAGVPRALATVGALVIGLTYGTAYIATRKG